jgi:glyoxylase-like metal-dependent hydrolase (beta-lactamase superfamily II)
VLVVGFPAQAFGTNCFVIAPAPGEQCVVIDPGIGVIDQLDAVLTEHRLHPIAVLLTHGHLDHTFSVAPVCQARGVPAYIHPRDRELLADPGKALSTDPRALFGDRFTWAEPDDVQELGDGKVIELAGLSLTIDHAPGHTGGSVMFQLPTSLNGAQEPVLFTGDVLFRDSIGRTDLPGGSMTEMMASLRDKVLTKPDETVVLPGHGPETTIGRERAHNPFLREASGTAPRRGL